MSGPVTGGRSNKLTVKDVIAVTRWMISVACRYISARADQTRAHTSQYEPGIKRSDRHFSQLEFVAEYECLAKIGSLVKAVQIEARVAKSGNTVVRRKDLVLAELRSCLGEVFQREDDVGGPLPRDRTRALRRCGLSTSDERAARVIEYKRDHGRYRRGPMEDAGYVIERAYQRSMRTLDQVKAGIRAEEVPSRRELAARDVFSPPNQLEPSLWDTLLKSYFDALQTEDRNAM